MSDQKQSGRVANRLLYRYIQLAYEYADRFSYDPMGGDRLEFLAQLYGQRMESVLTGRVSMDRAAIGLTEMRAWLEAEQNRQAERIIVGGMGGITFGPASPEAWERAAPAGLDRYAQDIQRGLLPHWGLDAYATYLPIHFFFNRQRPTTAWGVYISEQGMMNLATVLRREYRRQLGAPVADTECFAEMAYQILLRHELEHFKIEVFALNAEMFLNRAVYVPYLLGVYAPTYPGPACLEEGLANSAVLNSVRIKKIFETMYPPRPRWPRLWQPYVEELFFRHQPPAYQNVSLRQGWPHQDEQGRTLDLRRRAMNYLCNQIVSAQVDPAQDVPFYAFPPDNFFLRAEHLVPIHIVTALDDEETFIQFQTPKVAVWEKFLRMLGYQAYEREGSHWKWRAAPGWPILELAYHGKELGPGSFKGSLRELGIGMGEFNAYLSQRRLPQLVEKVRARFQDATTRGAAVG